MFHITPTTMRRSPRRSETGSTCSIHRRPAALPMAREGPPDQAAVSLHGSSRGLIATYLFRVHPSALKASPREQAATATQSSGASLRPHRRARYFQRGFCHGKWVWTKSCTFAAHQFDQRIQWALPHRDHPQAMCSLIAIKRGGGGFRGSHHGTTGTVVVWLARQCSTSPGQAGRGGHPVWGINRAASRGSGSRVAILSRRYGTAGTHREVSRAMLSPLAWFSRGPNQVDWPNRPRGRGEPSPDHEDYP